MRLNCAKVARLAGAALLSLCVAGCQSNSERDLIARDRRMQEDQMWAMQDYIQQYQQLVCRFRSENASLRRQLNDDRSGATTNREPLPVPRTPVKPPATNRMPNIPGSPAPGEKKEVPSPNIEMPDVPPLSRETSIGTGSWTHSYAQSLTRQHDDRYAQLASYETPVGAAPTSAAREVPAATKTSDAPPNDSTTRELTSAADCEEVVLSGETVANHSGGGPRLMIDIEPFDKSGHIVTFDGSVSLSLVTSEAGVQRRLARWDFRPEDVRSAMISAESDKKMRFRVELPADTKGDGATELWAKLAPTSGGRLFSHAKLSLMEPGIFSSRIDKGLASENSVVAASYTETSNQPVEMTATTNESDWSTAKPGQPAVLPPESDATTGGWKAASCPLPAMVEGIKPRRGLAAEATKPTEPPSSKTPPVEVARKLPWTPERPGAPSQTARPRWSATR